MTAISNSALAWLLTYAIHSTVLLALVWGVSRRAATSPAERDFLWKVALVGGIVTSTVQIGMGVRPTGSMALGPSAVAPSSGEADVAKGERRAASREATGVQRLAATPALSASPDV